MKQLVLNLSPTVQVANEAHFSHGGATFNAPVGDTNLQSCRERGLTMSTPLTMQEPAGFDFPGRLNIPKCHRKGQFQYRFGHKVSPPDWFLRTYKLDYYD